MKPPKMRVRTLLVVVLIGAIGLFGGVLVGRRSYCLSQAELYRMNEASSRAWLAVHPPDAKDRAYHAKAFLHFGKMKRRYQSAAARPWLALPPAPVLE